MDDDRLIEAAAVDPEDREFDVALRPTTLADFVGQERVKEQLQLLIDGARRRGESVDHLLFSGPPGLGKTTLAQIVANAMEAGFQPTSGPALDRPSDLAAILTNLEDGDVLFVDEIHRMPRQVEEVLYPALEDFNLDVVLGKGPTARSIRLELPRFTLVGATTRPGRITLPLRERFGFSPRLDYYSVQELTQIVGRSAGILEVRTDEEGALEIARRARGTPRSPTACCAGCAISPRCGTREPSRARSRATASRCSRSTRRGWTGWTTPSCGAWWRSSAGVRWGSRRSRPRWGRRPTPSRTWWSPSCSSSGSSSGPHEAASPRSAPIAISGSRRRGRCPSRRASGRGPACRLPARIDFRRT